MQITTSMPHKTSGSYKVMQSAKYTSEDWWDWAVWIDATERELDKIQKVIYNLHFSFTDPVREIKTREKKFKLESSGWGIFTIYVRIIFKDETVLNLEHDLHLEYPDGTVNLA